MTEIFHLLNVKLPLTLSDRDTGVLLDAAGSDVVTIDVNNTRPDTEVQVIAQAIADSVNSAAYPAPETHVRPADLTNEQKEITLLRIIEAMKGTTDSSENQHSWLNWFCADEIHNVQEDTFNRCNDKGWLHTTHNSDWDTSTTTLTTAGRAALAAMEGSDNG